MFCKLPSSRPQSHRTLGRFLAVEALERRDMLTAGPRVVAVEVASTSWSPDFVTYLRGAADDRRGYLIPLGTAAQSNTLTWTNLNQIRIKFDADVVLNSADLSISGVNHVAYAFSAFRYDPLTHWATWTLATPLGSDRLQLDLDGNGARPVRDYGANDLDGEWTNNSSTVSVNGTAGGDFEFKFNVQPADVNNSTSVTLADYTAILAQVGKTTTTAGYNAKYDIDGNGIIDAVDALIAVDRVFETLPTGSPAGTNNDAPTTALFGNYQLNEESSNLALSLAEGFADAENGSSGLTYTILSIDRPELFAGSASINSSNELVANAASVESGMSGRATIVVRATDAGGLFADTTVKVDVNYVNQPPVLLEFRSVLVGADTHIYMGRVADPDDNVSDLIVYVYGDFFETSCAVDENGDFEFAVILDHDAMGYEFAFVCDIYGEWSEIHHDTVGMT